MPRCEAYYIDFKINPLDEKSNGYPLDEICIDTGFLPEKLVFDEVKEGRVNYHV